MPHSDDTPDNVITVRERLEVRGVVQGVGFRPFVFSVANELNLMGYAQNHSKGVTIEVQGAAAKLEEFVARLRSNHPPLAQIDEITVARIPATNDRQFVIVKSSQLEGASTPIAPDVAVCGDCLAEMRNPTDRRFNYPFINCTNCGPRFTIVRDIPYDRPRTTMAAFPMCEKCSAEYYDPANRRFHAQPIACHECGPHVWFVGRDNAHDVSALGLKNKQLPVGHAALKLFCEATSQGHIVAVKGIGGFHLACDATNDAAIGQLRERKGRVDKPFAIMATDLEQAGRIAMINAEEERILTGKECPIVLLRRRPDSDLISELVAPGNDCVGIMLPYSPLHHLFAKDTPLVMTSGNISEEPIVRTNIEAIERLSTLADAFLFHNREIHCVCDDSVVRVFRGHELPIRRSRGYAPMPVRLDRGGASVLAVGGELKASFCMTKDKYAYMSQHIGDMGNLETFDAFHRTVGHLQKLFRLSPEVIACDLHPSYLSTQWAKDYAMANKLPLVQVQHHHAHIAALLAEHQHADSTAVIGVCFDGTGYGPDGAIWGGEFLMASYEKCERLAHLKYISLPGGDASIQRPYRTALAHLFGAELAWSNELPCVRACPKGERELLEQQLASKLNCLSTSSMGRMFDGVASLIGIRHEINYEGQAAMEMEARAQEIPLDNDELYQFAFSESECIVVDPAPVIEKITIQLRLGISPSIISARFHQSVAHLVLQVCLRIRERIGTGTVALSGGVFQNVTLLEWTIGLLERDKFDVLHHRQVPPNDGGLALGQAIIARHKP